MKEIEFNFSLPKDAYAVRELNGQFYVDNINGNFNHDFWDSISYMPKCQVEKYHPSVFFATRGEALMQSNIARIDHSIYKIKEMRSNKAINREQYLNAIARLIAERDLYEMGEE